MDFRNHLQVLDMISVRGITKPALIRHIYELLREHEGKDFKDLNDFFEKWHAHHEHRKLGTTFYDTTAVEASMQ